MQPPGGLSHMGCEVVRKIQANPLACVTRHYLQGVGPGVVSAVCNSCCSAALSGLSSSHVPLSVHRLGDLCAVHHAALVNSVILCAVVCLTCACSRCSQMTLSIGRNWMEKACKQMNLDSYIMLRVLLPSPTPVSVCL